MLADLNGDGRKELVMPSKDGLEVYLDVTGDQLFAKRAVEVTFEQPFGEATGGIEALDLDGDGKDDFLLRYPLESDVHGVGVLLSQAGEPD